MTTIHGTMPTTRADRYLDQICAHLSKLTTRTHHPRSGHRSDHEAPPVTAVERTPTGAQITFVWGECTATSSATALDVSLTVHDPERLAEAQDMISSRLASFAHREGATVAWRRSPQTML